MRILSGYRETSKYCVDGPLSNSPTVARHSAWSKLENGQDGKRLSCYRYPTTFVRNSTRSVVWMVDPQYSQLTRVGTVV